MIQIDRITISQESLRKPEQLKPMIEFVRAGGVYTQKTLLQHRNPDCTPIILNVFPDKFILARDGNHRITSILLAGRNHLIKEEYVIEKWDYDSAQKITFYRNPSRPRWVTPFEPKTQVRIEELKPYKTKIQEVLTSQGESKTRAFIRENPNLYCRPRTIHSPNELAKKYKESTITNC